MATDEEDEAFLLQDLSDLDVTAFEPVAWQADPKTARVNTAPRSR